MRLYAISLTILTFQNPITINVCVLKYARNRFIKNKSLESSIGKVVEILWCALILV